MQAGGDPESGLAADAIGVSVDTARRWERDGRIVRERGGNRRELAPSEFTPRRRGARDEELQRGPPNGGVVVGDRLEGVIAQVHLACGPYRVVSLISRQAAEALDLSLNPPMIVDESLLPARPGVDRRRTQGWPLRKPPIGAGP